MVIGRNGVHVRTAFTPKTFTGRTGGREELSFGKQKDPPFLPFSL
jgi:hypothetical protein